MAIEQITPEQKEAAENALANCKLSMEQDQEQIAQQAAKQAKEQADEAMQALAQIPNEIIQNIQDAITLLTNIVSGYNFPGSPSFDADAIIDSIIALVDPVIAGLDALPIPSIPGLSNIVELLAKLSSIKLDPADKEEVDSNFKDKLPSIPPEFYAIVNALLAALQTIAYTLPLSLISLIFNMLNTIIGLFQQIAGVIGVPGIPPPLSLVPDCITLMPKILDLIPKFGIQIGTVVENKVRSLLALMTVKQFPEPPEDITQPELNQSCPNRPEEIPQQAEEQQQ